jgi:hypothetical protein
LKEILTPFFMVGQRCPTDLEKFYKMIMHWDTFLVFLTVFRADSIASDLLDHFEMVRPHLAGL